MNQQVHVFPVSAERPAPKRPLTFPVVIIVGFAVLAAAIAAVNDKAGVSLVLALCGAWFVLLAIGLARMMRTVTHRHVRIRESDNQLTFVPSQGYMAILAAVPLGAFMIWLVLLALLRGPDAAETFSGLPMRSALVGLPIVVIYFLWTLRGPTGLTLSPHGLAGVKFATRVALSWDEVSEVRVEVLPGRGKLVFNRTSGGVVSVDTAFIGSDAHAVATVVRHFMEHPEDRERLAEGTAVLAMFDAMPAADRRH